MIFPDAKNFSRHFDAVVFYLTDANDFNFIKDLYNKYSGAPIKAFIVDPAITDFSHFKGGKTFVKN